jgi:hypothetical protein
MLRKFLTLGFGFILTAILAPTQVFADIIEVNINGGGWVAVAAGGTFNTGNNTNCGIAANCAENSAINVQAGGISITGAVAFTTTDVAGSTISALEQVTLTIDNTNACCAGAGGSPRTPIVPSAGRWPVCCRIKATPHGQLEKFAAVSNHRARLYRSRDREGAEALKSASDFLLRRFLPNLVNFH